MRYQNRSLLGRGRLIQSVVQQASQNSRDSNQGRTEIGDAMTLSTRPAVAVLILLAGCSDPYGPPLGEECESKTITLTVTIYDSSNKLNAARRELVDDNILVDGFATHEVGTDRHQLHVLRPRGRYDDDRFYLFGHELAHAVCGPNWHPVGERR